MIPIITRIVFSIPLVVISGSLLIESYFGIPGVGKITYDAIISGDQPVLKAVVGLTAISVRTGPATYGYPVSRSRSQSIVEMTRDSSTQASSSRVIVAQGIF